MKLINVLALKDNYIWIIYNYKKECIIIDPGESTCVIKIITKLKLNPIAILLTHHHADHVNGVNKLLNIFPIKVYGPYETRNKGTNYIVQQGNIITLLQRNFYVISLPGHTTGQIGFYCAPWLFSGDTIFSAGCGRLLEGTANQMYQSIKKIKKLPPYTLICAAHEYTLNNINFALSILPHDKNISKYKNIIKQLYNYQIPTLPTTLYLEHKINLFLRCAEINIQQALNIAQSFQSEIYTFTILRELKNNF